MIRVSVLYANEPGYRFDHDYYMNTYLPLLKEKMTPLGLVRVEIDKGISAPDPNTPPPFVVMGYLVFNSVEEVHNAFKTVGKEVMSHIPNYTDIKPQIQISEMVS